jgi:hypothetical protein
MHSQSEIISMLEKSWPSVGMEGRTKERNGQMNKQTNKQQTHKSHCLNTGFRTIMLSCIHHLSSNPTK